MTSSAVTQASVNLLLQLASPAARALALGAIAGLALVAFRVKATSTRLFAWTAVLYAAVAIPVVGWILPPMPVPVPSLLQQVWQRLPQKEVQRGANVVVATATQSSPPQAAERRQNAAAPERSRTGASPANATIVVNEPNRAEHSTLSWDPGSSATTSRLFETPLAPSGLPWSLLVAALYLAVASTLLARLLIGLAYGRRLLRAARTIAARTIDDALVTRKLASRISARVAESDLISVPVTIGALRPAILLPTGWREWDAAKLEAVLAHESSHVARHDALTQRLSLMHRAIFWFSPLAWFLDRHLANLAEEASDEAALSCGTDRKHYARILLDFFEALHAAPGRVWWQGVSMAKAGQAEQRVERILSWKGSVAMQLKKSFAVIILALAIPAVYIAASAHPQHVPMMEAQFAQDQTPPPAQEATAPSKTQPAATPAPAIESTPDNAAAPDPAAVVEPTPPAAAAGVIGGVPAVAPMAPRARMATPAVPPSPGVAPIGPAPRARQFYGNDSQARYLAMQARVNADQDRAKRSSYGSGSSYAYGYDDDQRFVIVTGKSDSLTMSGSTADAHHVQKLRKSIPGDFIWFQADEKSYIIRDQATIDRARSLWAPQDELGKKQEELGKQQEVLGEQQDALGAKMEKIQVKVPDMTAELDKLKAELKALGSGASLEQIGKIQEEMGALQEKIGEIQSNAGEEQGKLGEQMGALGEKQGALGEEQGKLGEQQAALAEKASKEMKLLLEDAVKKGLAQPEL